MRHNIKTGIQLIIGLCLLVFSFPGNTQTPGLIYKPAGNALGKAVLDPNGDGYTSLTSVGFSGTDYGSASELNMVPLPVIGAEPVNDLTTGSGGGATDIASFNGSTEHSCYILFKTLNNIPYLVIRFRLGGSSTATKGYTLLFDTDGTFGAQYNASNPGFEKEVVLETGNTGRIAIYTLNGSGATLSYSYSIDNYQQRSVALSTNSSDADYFYDYFVPYNDLGISSYVRIAAATITSAQSGITGTISDFNGVNDALYGNNRTALFNALVSVFPTTGLTTLTSGASFASPKTLAPVVTGGITTASTSINGTSSEANGTLIQVYKNSTALGSTVSVTSNAWSLGSWSGTLAAGDLITAKATAPGKTQSDASSPVTVSGVQSCYLPAPVLGSLVNGQTTIPVTWTNPAGTAIPANAVWVRLYNQQNNWAEVNTSVVQYIPGGSSSGTLNFASGLNQNTFDNGAYFATVTYNGCTSGHSNCAAKVSSAITIAPTITTPVILASPTVARNVAVTNNHTVTGEVVYLKLYINGIEVQQSATTVAANASYTFSYTGFIEGDIVMARAQSTTSGKWLSGTSNSVTVSASSEQTNAPVISGTYFSGSGKTVSGTSSENAGTTISLYKASTTLLGTSAVTAYGTWSVTGLTLATGDVLIATAKATGKTLSVASNSVTVQASQPAPPSISGSYTAGATSVSGTGGSGTVTVYVAGSPIGTTTGVSWTLTGIATNQLFKGAVLTATNTVSGIESLPSSPVTVTGVNSFLITNTSDGSIGTQTAGTSFPVKITARDGAGGAGNTVTAFTGKVVITSTSVIETGGGQTAGFTSGILSPHYLTLITPGSNKTITAVSLDDPTASGTATVALINPGAAYKLMLNTPADILTGIRAAYTVTRTDAWENVVTSGSLTVYLSASGTAGSFYNAANGGSVITSLTIPEGESTSNFWFTSSNPGTFTVTVSDAATPDGNSGLQDDSDDITASGAPSKYIVTVPNSNVPVSNAVTVTAQLSDADNNPVSTSGLVVTWSSTNGGSFSSGTSTTDASGKATVSFTVAASPVTHAVSATTGSYTGNTGVNAVTVNTWVGGTAGNLTNWSTSTNWSLGSVPVAATDVLIPDVIYDPVINESSTSPALCRDLTINSGAVLTVSTGKALTVNGTLTNYAGNGGLVIKSASSASTGSLITLGTVTGGSSFERYIDNSKTVWDWHMLSSPVASQSIWPNFAPEPGTGGTLPNTFYTWSLTGPIWGWDYYYWNPNIPFLSGRLPWVNIRKEGGVYNNGSIDKQSDDAGFGATTPPVMQVARGYLNLFSESYLGLLNVHLFVFTGTLNTGSISVNVANSEYLFNLVGNPYPSSIDWKAASGWTRTGLYTHGSGYDYWVYNEDSGNYGVFNSAGDAGTNGLSQYIAPAQAFFVAAASTSSSQRTLLSMNNSVRVHSSQPWLKNTATQGNAVKLRLTNDRNTFSDEMVVEFNPAFPVDDGSAKFGAIQAEAPEIWSVKNNKKYSIDRYQETGKNLAVNIAAKAAVDGIYTITAVNIGEFLLSSEVILEDMKTGLKQDLMRNPSYTYAGSTDDEVDRFRLTFSKDKEPGKEFAVFFDGQNVVINQLEGVSGAKEIRVFDYTGKLVYDIKNETAVSVKLPAAYFIPGVYIIVVKTSGGTTAEKLVIR